jgi:hypothetical protein
MNLWPSASPKTRKMKLAEDLLPWVVFNCLLHCAQWKRRSIVTIHGGRDSRMMPTEDLCHRHRRDRSRSLQCSMNLGNGSRMQVRSSTQILPSLSSENDGTQKTAEKIQESAGKIETALEE